MKAFVDFSRTILRFPKGWLAWIGILLAANMVAPLFFLDHVEGVVVLVGIFIGMFAQVAIFSRFGFARLLGLGHFHWIPMLIWLATRFDPLKPEGAFEYWMLSIIILNSLSLLIDITDVIRYARGEREPQLNLEG